MVRPIHHDLQGEVAVTRWKVPIPYALVPTKTRDVTLDEGETQLPIYPHPGGFATRRRYEVHTGIDLYCPVGTSVRAVEAGVVVGVEWFTGPDADPPCPWWMPTQAVLVSGDSGVVLYGEIGTDLAVGQTVEAGEQVGWVRRVLKNDKGLPTSMLHLELHASGTTRSTHPWRLEPILDARPASLRDPTLLLLQAIGEGP